jgi:hypothetical protein
MSQASGHPDWEPPHTGGLPAIARPEPQPVTVPRTEIGNGEPAGGAPVQGGRTWLGWSPTSWRARGR